MAENLGQVDLVLKTDEAQTVRAHEHGGKAAAQTLQQELGRTITSIVGSVLQRVGAGALPGRIAGAAVANIGQIAPQIAGGAASAVGATAGRAASGAAGAVGSTAGGIAGSIGALAAAHPVILGVVAALAICATAGIVAGKALSALTNAAINESRRLASVNFDIAIAEAKAQIQELLRSIQTGKVLGPTLAEMHGHIQRIKNDLAPLGNLIKLVGFSALNGFLKAIETVTSFVHDTLVPTLLDLAEYVVDGVYQLIDFITRTASFGMLNADWMKPAVEKIHNGIDSIRKTLKDQNDQQAEMMINAGMLRSIEVLTGGQFSLRRDVGLSGGY